MLCFDIDYLKSQLDIRYHCHDSQKLNVEYLTNVDIRIIYYIDILPLLVGILCFLINQTTEAQNCIA